MIAAHKQVPHRTALFTSLDNDLDELHASASRQGHDLPLSVHLANNTEGPNPRSMAPSSTKVKAIVQQAETTEAHMK